MDPLRDEEDVKLLSRTVAKYVDKQWLAGAPVPPSAVDAAYAEWADGQRQMSFHDFDHDVNRFELSVGTDPGSGRIMVIARAENDDLMGAFEDMPEVEEYGLSEEPLVLWRDVGTAGQLAETDTSGDQRDEAEEDQG